MNNEPVDTWGHIANMSQMLNNVFKELFGISGSCISVTELSLASCFSKPFIIFTSILSMSAVFSASSKTQEEYLTEKFTISND